MKMRFDRQEQGMGEYDLDHSDAVRVGEKIKLTPWHWYLLLLVVCSPLIFFLIKFGVHVLTVRVSGYIALPQVEIRANEDGYIGKISVTVGQRIKAGEFLCKLERPELKKKESLLKSELDYLRNNPVGRGMKNAASVTRANLDFAIRQKNYLKKRLDEVVQLFNRGAAADVEVKFATFQYEQALAHLVDLDASMSRAKDSALMMQSAVESQEDLRIKELALERKKLELQVKALSVFSPILGSVSEIFVVEGGYVSRGDLVFTVTKNEKAYISAYLPSEDINYTKVGQVAKIVFADGERVPAKVVKSFKVAKSEAFDKLTLPDAGNHEIMVQLEFIKPVKQKIMDGLPIEVLF
ncbi:putative Secretion protein HlyD family protein [Crenothrix polyspora]|uniref:Putative Secretion protein HlyD family protein n=1 Tax=Crenothrix polyspora TaxID=360316 RepID=A0A1R4HJM7_9GAMM|nr:HlyD family efflux transporter periplasmic adaptor subunit [Crenothrix polyspora]SJM96100.1 putative Secretion protein HlyD family protein [Crenothrix polyspora]